MIRKNKSDNGQAIIEFAYVLPFLMIVVLGIIEFGVLFYDQAVVTAASREGARAGIVFEKDTYGDYWSEEEMRAKVQEAVNNYLEGRIITFGSDLSVTTTAERGGNIHEDGIDYYETDPGNIGKIEVAVAYQHEYLAIPNFMGWGDSVNLAARTIMRLE